MRNRTFKPSRKWWSAYGQLVGEPKQVEIQFGEEPKKKPKKKPHVICPTEVEEQIVLVVWMEKKAIPFFHVPNGGHRDWREAAKFKRMGVRPGVPDLVVPVARKGYHGLFLEVKRTQGGRLSDTQLFWRDVLLKEGYAWYEVKGAQEGIRIVEDYLGLTEGNKREPI